MGQIVCCGRNKFKEQSETMAAPSEGYETTSPAMTVPEVFDSVSCTIIKSSDQYDMHQQMLAAECDGVKVIINTDGTFSLKGDFINVAKAIEQLEVLKHKKLAKKNATEENKEQTSENCDPAKPPKRNRVLHKDLTPSNRQVDLSLSQQVPIDQHVWYYLKRKHQDKLDLITQQHLCVMKVVCDSSNEEITHSLEVVPFCRVDSDDAKKHVDDAVEEFAQLYQKVSEPGIVKESIKLPLALNQSLPQKLITELEEMNVFFLKGDDPCLVGPQVSVAEAKQKFSDFISGHKDNQQQKQPGDNLGQAQSSAADRVEPMKFKTPCGLTVYVSQGNLIYQSLDAIVNPANEYLGNGGGAARAIAKAAGKFFQRECDEHIKKNGELGITHVTHTSAGNLQPNIRYVIHTVGPRKYQGKNDEELFQLVKATVLNCLLYANDELNIHSIAIPAISSGIFGVSIEVVGRASYEALKKFDEQYANCKKKSLGEIHFLNNDEATFSNMKRIFQSLKKDDCESSVDPERLINVTEALDEYAALFDRQRIETTPDDDYCFTRAFSTAIQRDLRSGMDWEKVREAIKKELDSYGDCHKWFQASNDEWSWANAWDKIKNFAQGEGSKVDVDVLISAAANALNVQIVLVQLSVKQDTVEERNVKPKLSKNDDTVYIAYYYDREHHHFDALIKKTSLEDNDSGKKLASVAKDASAESKKKLPALDHSHHMSNGHPFDSKNPYLNSFVLLEKKEAEGMSDKNASDMAGKKKENTSDMAGKKKENTSDMAGKNVTKPDGDKKDDKNDDDDNHCVICMDDITDKKELPCKHKFCRGCIDEYLSRCQPKCPSCGKVFGTLRGDQPQGSMTTKETGYCLNGYKDCGAIEISYSFNDGVQGANHPNPGTPYRGTHRTAYLPANKEGREVLRLLRRAFDAKLVFTIGRSTTTGQENVVVWNDVHHKTSTTGQYGYPDPTYLKRVTEELAAKGIK